MHITLMLTIIVLLTMEVQFFVIGAKLALTISCQCGNSKLTSVVKCCITLETKLSLRILCQSAVTVTEAFVKKAR